MKIGLIHTTLNSVEPSNAAFRSLGVETLNFLNEGVMQELRSKGATPRILHELMELVYSAKVAGCDGIMFNCSLMSPHTAKLAALVDIPLISADLAMLEYVVEHGKNVAVIATVPKAGPTTKHELEEIAQAKGKDIKVEVKIVDGAFAALGAGDVLQHNELIQQAARELDGKADMIVFAQISMVRALAGLELATPVVTSPEISARSLIAKIEEGK